MSALTPEYPHAQWKGTVFSKHKDMPRGRPRKKSFFPAFQISTLHFHLTWPRKLPSWSCFLLLSVPHTPGILSQSGSFKCESYLVHLFKTLTIQLPNQGWLPDDVHRSQYYGTGFQEKRALLRSWLTRRQEAGLNLSPRCRLRGEI